MGVTLRVVGPNSQILGEQATKVFTGDGRIGRAEYNDWVLPDANRFISSQHAEVVARADGVYLVDKSINGTYVNAADQPVGHGNSHRLQEGDRIRIGDYDILVSLTADQAASGGDVWPVGDPDPTPTPIPTLPPEPGFPDSDLVSQGSVDPLDHFGGSDPNPDPFADRPAGSLLDDAPPSGFGSYSRPEPRFDPLVTDPYAAGRAAPSEDPFPDAGPAPGAIPEDWDKTTMPSQPGRGQAAPPPPPGGPAGDQGLFPDQSAPPFPGVQPPGAPTPPAGAGPQAGAAAGGGAPAGPPGAPPPHPQTPPPDFQTPQADFKTPQADFKTPQAPPQPPPYPQAPHGGQAQGGVPGGLEALFQAAGLDAATARAAATAENAQVLGGVLKLVVQGMMEILSARAQIKNQFRVSMTQIMPVENNPLKFCVSPDDALNRLFVQRSQGFLGPGEAFNEAVEDVKAHQMAVMAGMRAAFDQLMARFDPQNLQKEFDRSLRRSALLQPLNKNKYWDMLGELYEEINRDGDANFSRLFGDEFARAYEAQMERLRSGR